MVRLFISRAELLPDDEDIETHQQACEDETQQVEKDRTVGKPFGGSFLPLVTFGSRSPIHDTSDRVRRCPQCFWELEDGWCNNCEFEYGLDGWPDDSDSGGSIPDDESIRDLISVSNGVLHDGNSPSSRRRRHPARHHDSHPTEDLDSSSAAEDDHDTDLDGFIEDDMPNEREQSDDSQNYSLTDRLHNDCPALHHDFPYSDSDSDAIPSYIPINHSHGASVRHPGLQSRRNRHRRAAIVIDSSDEESGSSSSSINQMSGFSTADRGDHVNFEEPSASESGDEASDDTAAPNDTVTSRPSRKRRRVVQDDSDDDDGDDDGDDNLGDTEDASLLSRSSTTSSQPRPRSESVLTATTDEGHPADCIPNPNDRIYPICLDGSSDGPSPEATGAGPRNITRPRRPYRMAPPVALSRFGRMGRSRRRQVQGS
jgi:hypothetical protein